MRRREQAGPVPRSARPPGIGRPPAGEWLLFAACAIVLATQVDGWVPWLLRALGAAAILFFVVGRIRYRVRRGEGLWLWHRI